MAAKFNRNRAPGWHSSDEEQFSEEGETDSSDSEDERDQSNKRSRTSDQGPKTSTTNIAANSGVSSTARKINNIWSDVLVDQQLLGGLSTGVNVMAGDTFVPRGSETYDCVKHEKDKSESDQQQTPEKRIHTSPEVTMMDKTDGSSSGGGSNDNNDDDIFGDAHSTEAPDLMESLVDRKRDGNNGSRKRPWQRGGGRGSRRGRGNDEGSSERGSRDRQGGERGGRGQWRGDGRGGGRGRGGRGGGGGRRIDKVPLNKDETPKEIALLIARSLHEVKTELISRAVELIGVEKAIELYSKTVDKENTGGLLTLDGRRRRTSGGIFLYYVREDTEIAQSIKDDLFGPDREEYRQKLTAKRHGNKVKTEDDGGGTSNMTDEKPLRTAAEVFLAEALVVKKEEPTKVVDESME